MSKLTWQSLRKYQTESLERFLMEREPWCVPFATALQKWKPLSKHRFLICIEHGDIVAALYISLSGLVIPAFSDRFAQLFSLDLSPKPLFLARPFSIMGKTSWTNMIREISGFSNGKILHYYLMVQNRDDFVSGNSINGISVSRMNDNDLDDLFPLQKGYELEEVVLSPNHFSDRVCRVHLASLLKEQYVFAALDRNKPLAKANTNALGISCEQIGGVYTLPEYRNRGLGKMVMSELIRDIRNREHTPCLFVKKNNNAAVALYGKLGFRILGDYSILYPGYPSE